MTLFAEAYGHTGTTDARGARAPVAIVVARTQERVARDVEAAAAQRDGANRIAPDGAWRRLEAAAAPRIERARRVLFPSRGRSRRRALCGVEQSPGDDVACG